MVTHAPHAEPDDPRAEDFFKEKTMKNALRVTVFAAIINSSVISHSGAMSIAARNQPAIPTAFSSSFRLDHNGNSMLIEGRPLVQLAQTKPYAPQLCRDGTVKGKNVVGEWIPCPGPRKSTDLRTAAPRKCPDGTVQEKNVVGGWLSCPRPQNATKYKEKKLDSKERCTDPGDNC